MTVQGRRKKPMVSGVPTGDFTPALPCVTWPNPNPKETNPNKIS